MQYALISLLDVYSNYHPQDGKDYYFVRELFDYPPVFTPELIVEQVDDTVQVNWIKQQDGSYSPPEEVLPLRQER